MLEIGVQTQHVVYDREPAEGFERLKRAGFSCVDFSLNAYLINTAIYKYEINDFFDKSIEELEKFFAPHKKGAADAGIRIHQMHMPYPIFVPRAPEGINKYLWNEVAPKSMHVCRFLDCRYIVVHGLKLSHDLGSEEAEWRETEKFLDSICPMAKDFGITVCVENIYNSCGGSHIVEGPCCDAYKAAERIDRINDRYGSEVLGFCFDTGHANLLGIDFFSFLSTLGNRLKVLHIHDNDGRADLHQLPFTFTRTRENVTSTDWEGFLDGLGAIDFDGVLSFETAPVLKSFPEAMKDDALSMIAKIGRYFDNELEAREKK